MASHTKATAQKETSPGGCTPLEFAALSVLGKQAKGWREHLEPGDHPVDLLVRIEGTLTVGDSQTATVKSKPDLETVLAKVFAALGPKTAEKVADALLDPAFEYGLEHEAIAKRLLIQLTVESEQVRAGNVTGKLLVARYPARA